MTSQKEPGAQTLVSFKQEYSICSSAVIIAVISADCNFTCDVLGDIKFNLHCRFQS